LFISSRFLNRKRLASDPARSIEKTGVEKRTNFGGRKTAVLAGEGEGRAHRMRARREPDAGRPIGGRTALKR
jgi:hypothetical protein